MKGIRPKSTTTSDICPIAASESERIIGFISIDFFKHAATSMPAELVSTIIENLKKDFKTTNENYARTGLLTDKTPKWIVERIVDAYRNADQPVGMAIMPEMLNLENMEKRLLPELNHKMYLANVNYSDTDVAPLEQYAGSGYEMIQLDGTCHYPMLENPDALHKAIETFIRHILVDLKKTVDSIR